MEEIEYIDVVVEHELEGVTPEMIDWWWDNINEERYALWHPKDHKGFTWEVHPKEKGHFGAIHVAVESIGEAGEFAFRIRWEEPGNVPIPITRKHAVAASILDESGNPLGWLVHEYEAMPGGTRMRSTFKIPAALPKEFAEHLHKHCQEEMGNLPKFLPELYRKEK